MIPVMDVPGLSCFCCACPDNFARWIDLLDRCQWQPKTIIEFADGQKMCFDALLQNVAAKQQEL